MVLELNLGRTALPKSQELEEEAVLTTIMKVNIQVAILKNSHHIAQAHFHPGVNALKDVVTDNKPVFTQFQHMLEMEETTVTMQMERWPIQTGILKNEMMTTS